ncbi:hypothetical protein M011DRAFT_103700 [Sporormia fimetaria CBS 119925]|uniref:Nuclear speckle splicing regulatory protein 1 N-terminal domain-containing protein n=1 Tax=Sporormia fimetaria CBS 119925 TaxID=1340428 RepID=A0A6A6VNP5_9PLEO|nr:hypothetical protein M011DRAFT_103700 [Sporormia fimetaria CBS 119925]
MSFKFGLNIKAKALNGKATPVPGKRKPLLDDEDELDNAAPKAQTTDGSEQIAELTFDEAPAPVVAETKPAVTKKKLQNAGPPMRPLQSKKDDPSAIANAASLQESQKWAQQASEVDPSIYDYDAAYDALQARTAAKKAAAREEELQGRPKYIENLLDSAEVRKKDRLRARDKVLQREREAEGDEFADKAKFVTATYKAQQEEAKIAEEAEKKKQEMEEQKRRKQGMTGFHRQVLLEDEKRHREAQAAMEEAAELAKKGVLPAGTEDTKEKTDVEIAKELEAQGKKVIVNDEGQIADKRQLLSAGLNVVAKPKAAAPATAGSGNAAASHFNLKSRNSAKHLSREKQTAMILEQLEQANKRKADEEAEERRKLEHASKSQKTEADIMSAKERYLQRKREAAAANATGAK